MQKTVIAGKEAGFNGPVFGTIRGNCRFYPWKWLGFTAEQRQLFRKD